MFLNDLYETSAFVFIITCLITISIIGTLCLIIFYIAVGILSILIIIRDAIKGLADLGLGILFKVLSKIKLKMNSRF